MSKKKNFPSSEGVRGFRDLRGSVLSARKQAVQILSDIYEAYGFEALETPVIETAEALGKFLPDVDRPAGGVFGFQDDDERWLALRYDLTAPLARFVAHYDQHLPKPFKRYQTGSVFRNEKPGPGRFREFHQFDADIVGTAAMTADAELCAMLSEGLQALGIKSDEYVININNRKLLTAVFEVAGLSGDDDATFQKRAIAFRAIDKLDRLGEAGVKALLGAGRKDASGDFTEGAGLSDAQTDIILAFTRARGGDNNQTLEACRALLGENETGQTGLVELEKMFEMIDASCSNSQNMVFNPAIVRGLGYYTGPVFEAELTFDVQNEKGKVVQFGSVAGGGRYDDLVARFTGRTVPATGVSIGLDRLLTALENRGALKSEQENLGPVIVTIMDRDRIADYARIAHELRAAGIKTELYLGEAGFKAQMKYADRRHAPIAVIQGSDESAKGEVLLKDLHLGMMMADKAHTHEEWRHNEDVQKLVSQNDIVSAVRAMLERIKNRV
ncbi:MAG: histidine--tRNA ligase [Pseudomonadota bacterium]